jgi:hypothetical protein
MSSNIEIKSIKPIINQDLFKLIKTEMLSILDDINKEYNISESLKDKYNDNISNIGIKFGIKKRNRRVLPNELQCMGRKLDGHQCTRSKRPGSDYCLSHIKNLPHGRIDDNTYDINNKNFKNKKKNAFEQINEDFIATHVEIIDNKKLLVDSNNNVYSYNIDAPVLLGRKVNNTLQRA